MISKRVILFVRHVIETVCSVRGSIIAITTLILAAEHESKYLRTDKAHNEADADTREAPVIAGGVGSKADGLADHNP